MHAPSRKFMIRAGIAAVAAIAIAIAVRTLLVQSRVFDHFSWGGREATILEPRWFYLLAINQPSRYRIELLHWYSQHVKLSIYRLHVAFDVTLRMPSPSSLNA